MLAHSHGDSRWTGLEETPTAETKHKNIEGGDGEKRGKNEWAHKNKKSTRKIISVGHFTLKSN